MSCTQAVCVPVHCSRMPFGERTVARMSVCACYLRWAMLMHIDVPAPPTHHQATAG